MSRPRVWPGATPAELARVQEAIDRLEELSELVGYWTPVGKVVEGLAYAMDPGDRERRVVSLVLERT